ncbi:WD repeat-containing protein 44 isoform X2 [Plodia interpunctella]|uniref:WD repeat-containing protein 44 isoform X2 n=1 Tax=Plodia interpunctella TaxID=58824 RepID=UPI0023679EB8|nr:WD repeat-containing protein 44 isoform X2 [Plodia interpunctella]
MGDSSDSEEFYDAEFTPIDSSDPTVSCKDTTDSTEKTNLSLLKPSELPRASTSSHPIPNTLDAVKNEAIEDDRTTVKNVVQGRRRFQELRRCMQTEEEDEVPDAGGSVDHQTFALEHPFKIIAHDTMSLHSMTSLGRIGRILSGAAESHPNLRDAAPAAPSREPSTISDDPVTADRAQNVLAMEPDVIASTKANSLKQSRGGSAVVAVCGQPYAAPAAPAAPVKPPRNKKRNKLHGSRSLSTADADDNLSVCTTDTDEFRYMARRGEKLNSLVLENTSTPHQTMALPSPASTIESLTREFQDSLELSNVKYDSERSFAGSPPRESSLSRGNLLAAPPHHAASSALHLAHHMQDVNDAVRASEERRGPARTHSEGRASHSSLGNANRRGTCDGNVSGSRRRSAGDEQQLGLALRTRTTSGHQLTDIEILEQVTVLNLDTGERVPLSVAEHKLPQCINPLSLHIMRLTSEYIGRAHDDDNARTKVKTTRMYTVRNTWRNRLSISLYDSTFNILRKTSLHRTKSDFSIRTRETDEESESVCAGGAEDDVKDAKRESADRQTTIRRKTENFTLWYSVPIPTSDLVKSHSQDNINKKMKHEMNARLKRFFGSTVKRTVDAAKSLAAEVSSARHKEDVSDIADDVRGEHNIKLKASNSHKGPYDFDGCVRHVQEMGGGHAGAVWCCKFSVCGRLLATAGQDKLLRVWVTRDAHHMFQDMRTKYNAEQKSSPTPSQESLAPLAAAAAAAAAERPLSPAAPFSPRPFCVYAGHTSDLLDVSWSKNYFILSSSMDKTVRLWHICRGECLCCFQHIDFVTAIVFHPRDDRYFLSGSLDGKLRLWDIPDKKVAVWNEVDGKTKLITAANFCQNGKFAVVGTYDGRCIFYITDQLKYHTQIEVKSTRGKNSTGRKISGIEPMPNDDKILITSNDSRIRLYDLRDLNLSCKYKGYVNVSSQIKASFSHDGKYIVSGSENQCIYIWKTYHDYSKFTSVRRDRNDFWEGIKAHNAVVTCAVFAPNPDHMIRMIAEREQEARLANNEGDKEVDEVKSAEGGMVSSSQTGHVLVSADFSGCIKVFVHKAKPKHSSLPASALA